jgi:hypothetical protein
MAATEFVANSSLELVKTVITFLTDPANFGTNNQWTLIRPATVEAITDKVIFKGVGDGEDEIYIGIKIESSGEAGTNAAIVLNGFAGYDAGLEWEEQPGAIYHQYLPTIPLVETSRLNCWLTATTSRFILIIQLSTQYECCYMGFFKPVAVERQYPYPLAIGGSYIQGKSWSSTSAGHSGFMNPGSDSYSGLGALGAIPTDTPAQDTTSLRIRRPDGTWRSAQNKGPGETALRFERICVWPQNTEPTNVLTVLDNSLTIENVIMFPLLLYETHPAGVIGQLAGIYFIGNREDLAAKDTLIHEGRPYKVFNNVHRRDNDEYFAIEWF